MKPIRETCIPRAEVLKGDLEDAVFAADFGLVVEGRAPKVYQDPEEFFRNTHPATPLTKVVITIFERLANPQEAGAAVRLSTGFGGGKTHTLIALWHLAKDITRTTLGTELLPAAGRPKRVVVAGIDAGKFGSTVCGSHGGLQTHSLWGELAFQLGGEAGYQRVQALDELTNVPDAATIRAMFPEGPTLILFDELVEYMAKLKVEEQKPLLAFLSSLIAEVGARSQAVVVITDTAGQPVWQDEAEELKKMQADQRLAEVLGRRTSDFDPIGDETAQVIIRRLFERVDKAAAQEVSVEYHNAYQRVAAEYPDLLPPEAASLDYANRRIILCYPFHPRLLESVQERLGAIQDFQKSRGVLRLFGRILRDTWESQSDVCLISAGDLDWTSERIQADLLHRIRKDPFKAAVDADVVRHAGQLDRDYSTDIHRRVASALLLESLPLNLNAAMDKRDLTLATLRPGDVGNEPGEAIDRLISVCWHTYRANAGKFQFRYEPNAIKIVEERMASISPEDAKMAVLTLAQNYFGGHTFSLVPYPSGPKAVQDTAKLKLVLSDSETLAQAVCDYQDDSNPEAREPRRFRNAIFGVAPTPGLLQDAVQAARRVQAAEEVQEEHKKSTPLREQLDGLLPGWRQKHGFSAVRAFNRVVFQGRRSVTLAENYLVSRESALTGAESGQTKLKDFLDDNGYIYQAGDALDVDLLLDEIMPGATPSLEHQGAYPASSVHERALENKRLKLMLNPDPVRKAILGAADRGRLVVRLPSGDAYDSKGCVYGLPGARMRDERRSLQTLNLNRDVLLAPVDAPCVQEWLRTDEPPEEGRPLTLHQAATQKGTTVDQVSEAIDLDKLDTVELNGDRMVVANDKFLHWTPTIHPPGPVTTTNWDQAIECAPKRPLTRLVLTTDNSVTAGKLIAIAQPFGARSLTLSVTAGGGLKDGGQLNFAVHNARHNNPMKPIDTAKRLLRAAEEDTRSFSAQLVLDFGQEGERHTGARFEQARSQAGSQVTIEAHFSEEQPNA